MKEGIACVCQNTLTEQSLQFTSQEMNTIAMYLLQSARRTHSEKKNIATNQNICIGTEYGLVE